MAANLVSDQQGSIQEKIKQGREQLARASDAGERIMLLGEIGTNETVVRDSAAIQTLQQAIDLAREISDGQAETIGTVRLAAAMQHLNHPDAIRVFEQSLDLCRSQTTQHHCLQVLGEFNLRLGNTAEAIKMFEQALTLRQVTGDMAQIEATQRTLNEARKSLEGPPAPTPKVDPIPATPPDISLIERVSYRSYAVVQLGVLVLLAGVLALNGFTPMDVVALLVMAVVTLAIQRFGRPRPTKEVDELELLRGKLSNGVKYTLVELIGTYCVGCVAVNPLVDQLEIEGNPRLQVLRLNIESPPGVYLKPDKSTFTPTFLLYDPSGNKIRETYLILDRARILYEVERLSRGSGPLVAP